MKYRGTTLGFRAPHILAPPITCRSLSPSTYILWFWDSLSQRMPPAALPRINACPRHSEKWKISLGKKVPTGYHMPGMFRHFSSLFLMWCYLGNQGQLVLGSYNGPPLAQLHCLANIKKLWMSSHRKGWACSNDKMKLTATWAPTPYLAPTALLQSAVLLARVPHTNRSNQVLLCTAKVYSENYNSRKALQEKWGKLWSQVA